LAEQEKVPICQDTGILSFYITAGPKSKGLDKIEQIIVDATREATLRVPLRPNAVNPLTQKNSEDNTGRFIPQIYWEIADSKSLEISVSAKGGGSENVTSLGMLSPSEGIEGLKRFVVDSVIRAGAKPCPPTILGIATGGGADVALELAKKCLLRQGC
jgi:fumarate hydratase subunit alpha